MTCPKESRMQLVLAALTGMTEGQSNRYPKDLPWLVLLCASLRTLRLCVEGH
jgi:hypothetical protein